MDIKTRADIDNITAITPIDGRYRNRIIHLADFFSEHALFKYRFWVEIEYLIALVSRLPISNSISDSQAGILRSWVRNYSLDDSLKIKEIEQKINHDVKALEYFIREKIENESSFNKEDQSVWSRLVHFGLTSQDINNTAIPFSLKLFLEEVYFIKLEQLMGSLILLSEEGRYIPMLAHTHGQPASPTTIGKEIFVFLHRLNHLLKNKHQILEIKAKFGGATGAFNAHKIAYPTINWDSFADEFISSKFNLSRWKITTQIDSYDGLAEIFDFIRRINIVLLDFCKDIWAYIHINYFTLKVNKTEVGSSAMPHKVNPIDFENAEGNLGMANMFFDYLSNKLPISRLQRDLTDSTVLRNIGIPFSYTLIAFDSLLKGISKLEIHQKQIKEDLDKNWIVLAEAIQTILKREGLNNAYELLKDFTRTGTKIDVETLHNFIHALPVSNEVKNELAALSPHVYIGYSSEF